MKSSKPIEKEKIILSLDDIENYNKEIKSKTAYLYDLNKDTYTKKEIINFLNNYTIPAFPIYNNNKLITEKEKNLILNNRNISEIKEVKAQKGLIIKRTNLKSFPTDMSFYKEKNTNNFDNNQETEVPVNTPVFGLSVDNLSISFNFAVSFI